MLAERMFFLRTIFMLPMLLTHRRAVADEWRKNGKYAEPVTFPLSTKETRKYESGYEEIDGIVD